MLGLTAALPIRPLAAQAAGMIRLGPATAVVQASGGPLGTLGVLGPAAYVPGIGFAISDRSGGRIHVIGTYGTARAGIGRPGAGPGEFQEIGGIMPLGGDTIAVFDRAQMRLALFRTADPARTQPGLRLDYSPDAMCYDGSGYVALGYRSRARTVLARIDRTGRTTDVWGDVFFPEPDPGAERLVNEVATQGSIACHPRGALVLVAPRLRGEVRLYRNAQLLWRRSLEPFRATTVRVAPGGGVVFGRAPGGRGTELVIAVAFFDEHHVLVQSGLVTPERTGTGFDYAAIRTRLLRISDGAVAAQSDSIPVLLAHGPEGSLLGRPTDDDFLLEIRGISLQGRPR